MHVDYSSKQGRLVITLGSDEPISLIRTVEVLITEVGNVGGDVSLLRQVLTEARADLIHTLQ